MRQHAVTQPVDVPERSPLSKTETSELLASVATKGVHSTVASNGSL